MKNRPSGRIKGLSYDLGEVRLDAARLDRVVSEIGRLAVAALDGWDAAGACLLQGDDILSFGATDERVHEIDRAAYETEEGPCIEALKAGEPAYFDGEATPPGWERVAQAAANHGVHSQLAVPIRLNGRVMGALTFYSTKRGALQPGQREEGSIFAAKTAVEVAAAYLSKEIEASQLEEALRNRTVIGQATGLLMAREALTSDAAFQKLVDLSQKSNVKLREVARRYLESWSAETKQDTESS